MHSKVSGVSDFLARDEHHALTLARDIMTSIGYVKATEIPRRYWERPEEPIYPAEELLGIIPANIRTPFDVRTSSMKFRWNFTRIFVILTRCR